MNSASIRSRTPLVAAFVLCVANCLATLASAQTATVGVSENFDHLDNGEFLAQAEAWSGFAGFPGEAKPSATIIAGKGADGSQALAISHSEAFRADNFGLTYKLAQPYSDGVVWVQCRFQPPAEWKAGFFLDARGPERGQIIGRIAAGPFDNKLTKKTDLRWHCTWMKAYWRLYTLSQFDTKRWYTVTARIDLDTGMLAAWIDDQALGEEAPLAAKGPFSQLHLSFGGSAESPALVDDLSIGRKAPAGFADPQLLPEPEEGMLFRFAGVGDPQLGFTDYDTDKIKFGLAVDQINRAGVDLSVILGDMVHFNDKVEAYEDLASLAAGLDSPPYYIRGNHDRLDLYQKYFSEKSDFSVVHKGLRFVVVDAIGNQVGLSEQQLAFIETEFSAASKAVEEIILCLHVSPWQNNKKGAATYNQIGEGRDQLRALMEQHKVLLCLSGHYHTGLWHGLEEETHYLVLGGTATVGGGALGWCLFDVYPDRIVMHQKPLFFGYEKPGVLGVHSRNDWIPYEMLKKTYPYIQQGPLTIQRHRPVNQ
jgi:Icc-related predicted phosphoesterase